jgi:glycosyltransferase involved in cell wall biosynthesis
MPDVCVVMPCFNEERRLKGEEILGFLREHPNVAICFVDDGSSDGTRTTLDALKERSPQSVHVLGLPINGGKAEAVRKGILHAAATRQFRLIGYWDADLSTPLPELDAMILAFDADPRRMLAMGSRVRRLGANIRRSALRRYIGRVFSTLASVMLRLPVYDSQCGAKVVRADLADLLFGDPFLTRWLFDVEVMARLRNHLGTDLALCAMAEVPLTNWAEVGGSKLRLVHMMRAPLELLRLAAHYNHARLPQTAPRASSRGMK